MSNKKRNLIERLNSGPVICAEGFLFEIERRGYMSSGEFVPMVSLEHPEALENLHRDFQHGGSDIVEAFTYNGHREKMRVIGKEELLEPLNRAALKIAKKVANSPLGKEPNLMAGNISNSNIWDAKDPKTHKEVEKMFSEMVEWAVDEGADMLIGETFYYAEEAYTALKVMKKSGLPGNLFAYCKYVISNSSKVFFIINSISVGPFDLAFSCAFLTTASPSGDIH